MKSNWLSRGICSGDACGYRPRGQRTLAALTLFALLTAALGCAGEQVDGGGQVSPYPTYTSYPTYTPIPAPGGTTNVQPANTQAAHSGSSPSAPGQPGPQPTDDPRLRDISPAQHQQLDQQIADLHANPQILADCAAESGDAVPPPGSPGEAEWYGQAAIRYSACAASKATGVDLTGGN